MIYEEIHPQLLTVMTVIDQWCKSHQVLYDITCDERNIQGIKIFNKNKVSSLIDYVTPFLANNRIHIKRQNVRGGILMVLSLEAISESKFNLILNVTEEKEMSLIQKLNQAMDGRIEIKKQPRPVGLYKLYESAIRISEKLNKADAQKGFKHQLLETLENYEPQDLFAKFAVALKVLGEQMGIGPLQDVLKQQGIKWKKSDDGRDIILYVLNAQTKAPQPISRISSETLSKPHDFEDQLMTILDFAKGDAPGAFKQKQEAMRDQEKAVRDIAQSVAPKETESEIDAGINAATTAAVPKQPVQTPSPANAKLR